MEADRQTRLTANKLSWQQCQPSPELLECKWYRSLPNRDRLTLAALMFKYPDRKGFDITQQVVRNHDSNSETEQSLATLTPGARVFLPHRMRFLTGAEAMHIQGVPMAWVRKAHNKKILSDCSAKDFASNAYTCSVVLALYISLLVKWPFPVMATHQAPASESIARFL